MNAITITRHSQRGRPIASPVAKKLSLEEELEAEIEAFEQTRARAEILISRLRAAVFIRDIGGYAVLTLSLSAVIWLAARLFTGV